eukprot:scaffold7225_cov379-Prasinococcus_capsulatus_cf.AAC.19
MGLRGKAERGIPCETFIGWTAKRPGFQDGRGRTPLPRPPERRVRQTAQLSNERCAQGGLQGAAISA